MAFTDSLITICDAYCLATGLSRGRLGTLVFNDGKAFGRIAAGGDLNTRSFEKAVLWFAANWPEGAEWPRGIDRPLLDAPRETERSGAAA